MARPLALKVLHIASSMPDDWGGVERYVCYLATAMAQAGHEVTVAAVPGSPLGSRLPVPQLPARLRHKYDLTALGAYVRLFRSRRWDFAVTHFSPDYLVPAWAARLAGGPRMVLTRHVAVPMKAVRARQYSRLYQGFVSVSEAVAATLRQAGIADTEVAHPGIPDPGRKPFPDPPLRASVVGRLVREKGQRVALAAARGSSWSWDIAGSGPDEELLQGMAGKNVHLLGQVSDPIETMAGSHAVVVPSSWVEAFGLVAVEAMAVGRCVVASCRGGLAEIVQDGVTGLLVPPDDPDSLRAAMEGLTWERAQELGRAGRLRYESKFTVEAMERRTSAAYEWILTG
ncbi:MAG: glycosyltransferase family 4 protein [Fimbriimonadaceae bacterium]